MEMGGFGMLEATDAGLREGVFFESLLGDPPLVDDVRRATVRNLAAQYDADFAHAEHVAQLALELWDGLAAAGVHRGDPTRARVAVGRGDPARHRHRGRLRRPPQALALPDPQRRPAGLQPARGRHSSARPRATTARATRASASSPRWRARATRRMLNRLAAAVRIAEQLERSRDQSVRACDVHVARRPRRAAPARRRGRHDRPLGDRTPGRRLPQGVRPRPKRHLKGPALQIALKDGCAPRGESR